MVPIHILLLLACYSRVYLVPECLFWWGLLLCLLCLDIGECWYFIHTRGNWPWCPCNKHIGGGWHSTWPWSVICGQWGCGCGSGSSLGLLCHRGLPWLEVNGLSSSWNFLVELWISWILLWAKLYAITYIGLGLVVVVVGFTTDICVEAAAVATASGSAVTSKNFSTSLTLNYLFMGVLVLLFLSATFLGIGVFCSEMDLPSQ